ncbi:hypothetical protein C7B77_28510 [Chamaesiphon polymorphus CCALA 037]|uniref:Uncharacterized protein n=1 Tax=Chamaesiphon polymorphus CCALA 037 TaxID=2107692 RepID=A0A2T1F5P5_9CYAN|nr:hypothetical protein C7B77_28510 [Chamaesiphon polymorphus CCALA 037]
MTASGQTKIVSVGGLAAIVSSFASKGKICLRPYERTLLLLTRVKYISQKVKRQFDAYRSIVGSELRRYIASS